MPVAFWEDLLPNNALIIEAARLNDSLEPASICSREDIVFGELSRDRRKIRVSKKLIAWAAASGAHELACLHGSIEAVLQATVIHELAHLYDARHQVSQDKRFRGMVVARKGRTLRRSLRNYNGANSPDAYEFKNVVEAFAVNLEYYVMDERYRCARPALTAFFDRQFDADARPVCRESSYVLVHSHILSDNLIEMASIDPDSVYAVHYLHAADGTSMASRWGHAMFRLVTCAPHRKEVNADCLADVAHHLVLSYRANVVDLQINYLKGLWGAYPSRLFIYELPEIIKEYARHEFRNLISIPLKLSAKEKSDFLALTLERYWNYRGKYYFISNHCGTESVRHLNTSLQKPEKRLPALTPRGLLRKLGKTRLVDRVSYEAMRNASDPSPYFFPSRAADYESAFASVQGYDLFPQRTFSRFIKKSDVADREAAYQDFFTGDVYQSLNEADQQKLVREMLFLERLLQSREKSRLSEEVVRLLKKTDANAIEGMQEHIRAFSASPWVLVEDGAYGVPDKKAIRRYLDRNELRTDSLDELQAIVRSHASLIRVLEKLEQLKGVERMLGKEMVR